MINLGQVRVGNEGIATKEGGTWSMHLHILHPRPF